MIVPSDIIWKRFRQTSTETREGPLWVGSVDYKIPEKPTEVDRIIRVVTATESGRWDAVNMYDRAVCSVGVLQFIELGLNHISKMLARATAAGHGDLIQSTLAPALEQSKSTFDGKTFLRQGRPVTNNQGTRDVFWGGSSGLIGQWTPEQKSIAINWCCCVGELFGFSEMITVQRDYIVDQIYSFVSPESKRILWDGQEGIWNRAVRAAFISFAVNSPARANSVVKAFSSNSPKWSPKWSIDLIRALTTVPNIAFYPDRYRKIVPVIRSLYGVSLPPLNMTGVSVEDIQKALKNLGYEVGPIDGIFGARTESAVRAFQQQKNLTVDGEVGPKTLKALGF